MSSVYQVMTKPKIHLLGLIMPYRGVGSCSAKNYTILKTDALYTGVGRLPPAPLPTTTLLWLSLASSCSYQPILRMEMTWRSQPPSPFILSLSISDRLRPPLRAPDPACSPPWLLPPFPPPPGTPASNPPDQDLGLLGVSHWASVRGPLPAPLDSPPRHIPALFFSMDECMTRPSPTKVPRGVLARQPGT